MRRDYLHIFQDARVAEKYDEVVYAPDSYSSAVSARQQGYLRRLVRRTYQHRRPVHHDFACGTGRAVRMLHGLVREAHGYDTSAAMLDKARVAGLYARWHEIPEGGPVPVPASPVQPAVVTVFRLLLNVPDEVRDRAIAFAAQALPTAAAGVLIVENHGNAQSLRHLLRRRHVNDPWWAELSHVDVERLLARHDFEIVTRHGFTLFPAGLYRIPALRRLIRWLDDLLCRLGLLSRFATDVLYVARRS